MKLKEILIMFPLDNKQMCLFVKQTMIFIKLCYFSASFSSSKWYTNYPYILVMSRCLFVWCNDSKL